MIVNKRQLADVMGCTEETLSQWEKQGMPVQLKRKGCAGNQYETAAIIGWRDARNQSDAPPTDYETERTRKVKLEADILALEKAQLEGRLIPADKAESAWISLVSAFRAKMLAIPSKCAPLVVGISYLDAESLLSDAIHNALSDLATGELADGIADQFTTDDEREPPAAEADREPMGRRRAAPVGRG